jgi:hypothetical protein
MKRINGSLTPRPAVSIYIYFRLRNGIKKMECAFIVLDNPVDLNLGTGFAQSCKPGIPPVCRSPSTMDHACCLQSTS